MLQKLTPAAQVSNSPPIEASSTAKNFNPSIRSDALADLRKVEYEVLICFQRLVGNIYEYSYIGYGPLSNIKNAIHELVREFMATWTVSHELYDRYRLMLHPNNSAVLEGIRDLGATVRKSIDACRSRMKTVEQSILLNVGPLLEELENLPLWHLLALWNRAQYIKYVQDYAKSSLIHLSHMVEVWDEYERDFSIMQAHFCDEEWVEGMQGTIELLDNLWDLNYENRRNSDLFRLQFRFDDGSLNTHWLRFWAPFLVA